MLFSRSDRRLVALALEPDDISNAVLFLASEESRYVTGEFISVDAGAHLKLLE